MDTAPLVKDQIEDGRKLIAQLLICSLQVAAALGGSPDLSMYSFDATTPGMLDPATSTATDADPAGATAIALTH